MSPVFEHHTDVGWFDLDANRHMKNTAYMEKSVDCRLRYFNSTGVSPDIFAKWKVAFVVVSDQVTYSKELFLGDRMRVQMLCGGINARGSRFLIVNRILAPDGERDFAAFETALRSGTALPAPAGVFPRHVEPEAA